MRNNWKKFKQLTVSEKALFAASIVLLPINALGLHLFGFNGWQAVLARTPHLQQQVSLHTQEQIAYAQQVARIVNIAAAHGIYSVKCLPRSMTLWWLLQRRGIASELRIGVRKDADKVEAHAWIECIGTVVNDRTDVSRDFTVFAERFDSLDTKKCLTL